MSLSLKLYSLWSAAAGAALLLWASAGHAAWTGAGQESLFLYALALWHGIYAIWFWKGRTLAAFARATVPGRLAMAVIYLAAAFLLQSSGAPLPENLRAGFLAYLLAQAAADIAGALVTQFGLRAEARGSEAAAHAKLKVEEQNRLLFAAYMCGVSAWVLLGTESFLAFFHLPSTVFTGAQGAASLGPIHLLGAQILLLAYFNLVAVRNRLTPLVDAGVRGGLFTCVFFIALVALGLLHPLTLLLPMVDLLSVVWIFLSRRLAARTAL